VVDHAVELSVSTKYLKLSNILIVEKYEKGVINEKGITLDMCRNNYSLNIYININKFNILNSKFVLQLY